MTTTTPAEPAPYLHAPGDVPLPGYTLIAPLGRGGFGEVWECEAPGGLHKAVKFVRGDPDAAHGGEQLRQELGAFEQIKAIRHPFLLTLERVELLDNELVMVMELADRQLADRFTECTRCGLPGVPRDELIGYLADAAEALDVIGAKFGLQHLDVKPANLFLVSGRVKVGDYGLVSRQEAGNSKGGVGRGLTPRYVAPEVLRGRVDTRSDQYSLALVYYELLTGGFPYTGKNAAQLMMQHTAAVPDLSSLPDCDIPVVAAALSKQPEDRFTNCLEFVRNLMAADPDGITDPGLAMRKARIDRAAADPAALSGRHPAPEEVYGGTPRHHRPGDTSIGPGPSRPGDLTVNRTSVGMPRLTTPGNRSMPPLVAAGRRPAELITTPPPAMAVTPGPRRPAAAPARHEDEHPEGVVAVLKPIRAVVPVANLTGAFDGTANLDVNEFAAAVLTAAAGGGHAPQTPDDIARRPDGTWVCGFPSTVPASLVPLKLTVPIENWGVVLEQPEPGKVVLRKLAPTGLWGSFSGKKSGLEVTVKLAGGKAIGEVTVTGGLFGTPDDRFAKAAQDALPRMLSDVRQVLGNVTDRRRSPRLATDLAVNVYPIHSAGGVEAPIAGRCRDVSAGGVCVAVGERVPTAHVFVEFPDVAAVAGSAALVRLARSTQSGRDLLIAGPYRTDI